MPYAGFLDDAIVLTKPKAEDLRTLAAKQPRAVTIFEYPFDSLKPLAVLTGVEILKIQDSGAMRSLDGAASLLGVKNLVISTPPTWDGSNRRIEVASLRPLAALTSLDRLLLLGVRPADLDLTPIMGMTHLKEVDIGGVPEFTIAHYAKLSAALPNAQGRCLQPYFEIKNLSFCKKCKTGQVMLNGTPPRARRFMCPNCNAKQIAGHVRAWEALKIAPG